MADLEAQTQTGAQRSEIQSALMARRELRQLVQMLADSVKLVQSMVELDDERRPNQNDEHIELRTIEADSESENYVVEQGEMIGDDNEHEEGERVAKMPVLSQEEILNWMLAKQREFESRFVVHDGFAGLVLICYRTLCRQRYQQGHHSRFMEVSKIP